MRAAGRAQLLAYGRDVCAFRLGGVALYQSALNAVAIALASWVPVLGRTPRSGGLVLLCWLALLALQLLPSLLLSLLQAVDEPQPLALALRLPRACPPSLAALVWPAARVGGRLRRASSLKRLLVLTAGYAATGAAFMQLFMYARGAATGRGSSAFGAALGLAFALRLTSRGEDILAFPVLQRHRLFRVKQGLLPALASAAWLLPAATLLCAALSLGGARPLAALWQAGPLQLLTAGALCAACFALGALVVRTVFSERLSFQPTRPLGGAGDGMGLLFAALQEPQAAALHAAALAELCSLAEAPGRGADRWAAAFSDESGAAWQVPAQACLREIDAVTAAVAEGLPQAAPMAEAASQQTAARRWNRQPASIKPAAVRPNSHQAAAAWQVRARLQRCSLAVRALAALAAASKREDSYGVVQLSQPELGALLQRLLSLLAALQQHLRACGVRGRRRQAGGAEADEGRYARALEDTAATAVCLLGATFGSDLESTLAAAADPPPFGSAAEVLGVLRSCVRPS